MKTKPFLAALALTLTLSCLGAVPCAAIGNPSSIYCVEQGGKSVGVMREEPQGEIGLCVFADGARIEEWTLFHQANQFETQAASAFHKTNKQVDDAVPENERAEKNCLNLGGKITFVFERLQPTARHQLCRFTDKSSIELQTLLAGPARFPDLAKIF